MNTKKLFVALLAATLLGAAGWSFAAGPGAPGEQATPGMQGMNGAMTGNMGADGAMGPTSGGMMASGMMGMMGGGMMGPMMGGCAPLAQASPANQKLAMRMRGEMMQAMGAILIKYADKFQPQPAK